MCSGAMTESRPGARWDVCSVALFLEFFRRDFIYHNRGSFLYIMKTHSKYRMFSIPRSDLCFLHTFGEVAPSQCTTSFPKHCCVDLLACLCNKEVSLLTWIDIHLYFYTLVGLIVCLISGDRDNHFSLSPAELQNKFWALSFTRQEVTKELSDISSEA